MALMSDRFLDLCRWFVRVLGAHRIILRADGWSMSGLWVEKPNAVKCVFVSYSWCIQVAVATRSPSLSEIYPWWDEVGAYLISD